MLGGSLVEIEASDVSLYPTLECLVGWKLLSIDFLKHVFFILLIGRFLLGSLLLTSLGLGLLLLGSGLLLVFLDPSLGKLLRRIRKEIKETINEEILVDLFAIRGAAINVKEIAKVLQARIGDLASLLAVLALFVYYMELFICEMQKNRNIVREGHTGRCTRCTRT